jgi:hypothetical protein
MAARNRQVLEDVTGMSIGEGRTPEPERRVLGILGGMGPLATVDFMAKIIRNRLGITAILVTHDQAAAMTMSDRIAVMTNGAIAQLGSPEEVYERPTSEIASRFLGHVNILSGKILSLLTARTQSV